MADRGGQLGNTNATKGKPWAAAISRALAKPSRIEQKETLDDLAESLIKLAKGGDMTALKELGDRLDGKAAQSIEANVTGNARIVAVQGDDKT